MCRKVKGADSFPFPIGEKLILSSFPQSFISNWQINGAPLPLQPKLKTDLY